MSWARFWPACEKMEGDSEEPGPTRAVIRLPFRRLVRVFTARRSGSPVGSGLEPRSRGGGRGGGRSPAPVRWRIDAGLLQGGTASGAEENLFTAGTNIRLQNFAAGKRRRRGKGSRSMKTGPWLLTVQPQPPFLPSFLFYFSEQRKTEPGSFQLPLKQQRTLER